MTLPAEGEGKLRIQDVFGLFEIALVDGGVLFALLGALDITPVDVFDDADKLVGRTGADGVFIFLLTHFVALDPGYGYFGDALDEAHGFIGGHDLADIVVFALYGHIKLGILVVTGNHKIVLFPFYAGHTVKLYDVFNAANAVVYFNYKISDLVHAFSFLSLALPQAPIQNQLYHFGNFFSIKLPIKKCIKIKPFANRSVCKGFQSC